MIIIIIVCVACVALFLVFSTPLFFEKSKFESVTVFFNPIGKLVKPDNPDSISINLTNPFTYSDAQIKMQCNNFNPIIDIKNFTDDQVNDYIKSNISRSTHAIKSYIFLNSVEFQDKTMYKNTVPILAEIACVEPISVKVNPFFKQTSINTWEGSIFFDSWNGSLNLNPNLETKGNLIKITPNKLIITMFIPDSYDIEPSDKLKLEKISDNYIITSELEPGESLDIKVSQKGFYINVIILSTFLCPLILGLILGPIVDQKLKEHKSK